jgi:uncharacterized protein (DUF2147 family)
MRVCLAALTIIAVWTLALQGGYAHADEASAAGLWQQVNGATGKPSAWFLVSEHDGRYDAALVKLFVKPGGNPNPPCTRCLGAQQNLPWLGLTIVKGMERDGLDYENGTILDPRNGSQYFGHMQLSPDGQTLTVVGDLGIDPLGGDETWRRLPETAINKLNPAVTAGQTSTTAAGSGVPSAKSGD